MGTGEIGMLPTLATDILYLRVKVKEINFKVYLLTHLFPPIPGRK